MCCVLVIILVIAVADCMTFSHEADAMTSVVVFLLNQPFRSEVFPYSLIYGDGVLHFLGNLCALVFRFAGLGFQSSIS